MKTLNPVWRRVSLGLEEGGLNRVISHFKFMMILATFTLFGCSTAVADKEPAPKPLRFVQGEAGSFTFETGVLKGVLREEGNSIGLVPVTYKENGTAITAGEGLFNHYRVFTRGKRYGYGARRWPSTAELQKDGSVKVLWPVTSDRPFELKATYRLSAPNAIDLVTIVRAEKKLEAFEVFLASYFPPSFTDSRVWASGDPNEGRKEGFVSAKREFGDWLYFPRDESAKEVIGDGRWVFEPGPLEWTLMPNYARPLMIRRDTLSKLTVIMMTRRDDCFGFCTPYGEEKHYSNYMSLFGNDIKAGQTASACSRLVVLSDPTEAEILKIADEFLKVKSSP